MGPSSTINSHEMGRTDLWSVVKNNYETYDEFYVDYEKAKVCHVNGLINSRMLDIFAANPEREKMALCGTTFRFDAYVPHIALVYSGSKTSFEKDPELDAEVRDYLDSLTIVDLSCCTMTMWSFFGMNIVDYFLNRVKDRSLSFKQVFSVMYNVSQLPMDEYTGPQTDLGVIVCLTAIDEQLITSEWVPDVISNNKLDGEWLGVNNILLGAYGDVNTAVCQPVPEWNQAPLYILRGAVWKSMERLEEVIRAYKNLGVSSSFLLGVYESHREHECAFTVDEDAVEQIRDVILEVYDVCCYHYPISLHQELTTLIVADARVDEVMSFYDTPITSKDRKRIAKYYSGDIPTCTSATAALRDAHTYRDFLGVLCQFENICETSKREYVIELKRQQWTM